MASRGRQKSGYSFKQPAAEYLGFVLLMSAFERKGELNFISGLLLQSSYRGNRELGSVLYFVEAYTGLPLKFPFRVFNLLIPLSPF